MKKINLIFFLHLVNICQSQILDSTSIRTSIDSLTTLSNDQFVKGDFDASLKSRQTALPFIKKLKNWGELVTELNYIYYIAFSADNLIISESALDTAKFYSDTYLTKDNVERYYLLSNLGYYENVKANYPKSIQYYEEAVKGFKRLKVPFPNYYNNVLSLMDAYRQKGNTALALELVESYLPLTEDSSKEHNYMKPELTNYRGIFLRENLQYEEALNMHALALKLNKEANNKFYKDEIEFNILQSTAIVNKHLKNYDEAVDFFQRGNALRLNTKQKLRYYNHTDIADVYREKGDFANAIHFYRKGIDLLNKKNISSNKQKTVNYGRLAYSYFKTGQIDSARVYFEATEKFMGIPLEQKLDKIEQYQEVGNFNANNIEILNWIAEFKYHLANVDNNMPLKQEAMSRYQQAFNGARYLQSELMSKSSKYLLHEKLEEHFSNYLSLLISEYEKNPRQEILSKIFQSIEDNKAIILKEDIHDKTVLAQSSLPDSILKQEAEFISALNSLKKKVHRHALQEGQDSSIIQSWKNEITELKREYNGFQLDLENAFPNYYEKKYKLKTTDINALQELLSDNEVYLNYFSTEEDVYCAWISNSKASIYKVGEKENVFHQVSKLLDLIRKGNQPNANSKSHTEYKQTAHGLYIQLFNNELSSKHRYIISPTSLLHYLPFETLLSQVDNDKSNYKELSYLVNDKTIEYSFSSDLWLESKEDSNPSKTITVSSFAPFSEGKQAESRTCSADFEGLPCTDDEIQSISKYFTNESKTGQTASLGNFKSSVDQSILHLATHACLDDADPNFNKLIFADEELSLLELENMDLTADLAILSACNTGSGKLESGEGVINLGKGFRKAGVKSLMASLWALNDCSTSEVIANFYKELEASKDISSSLQKAKVDYIKSADKRHAHPYYWAGLVFTGDSEVFKTSDSLLSSQFVYLLAAILCILLLFFYFKQK